MTAIAPFKVTQGHRFWSRSKTRIGLCDFILVNKSAQSNMARGPRRGAVAHVRPVDNGAPQKYPFPWTGPQTPLPASSPNSTDLRYQTASGSDPPLFHNALDRPTDRSTDARTDRQTDRSSTGKCDDYRPLRLSRERRGL